RESGGSPAYQQAVFAADGFDNKWQVLVTPDGRDGTLQIRQDAVLRAAKMTEGTSLSFEREPVRKYWLQVAQGKLTLGGAALAAGDGVAIAEEDGTAQMTATAPDTEVLLFDLPA